MIVAFRGFVTAPSRQAAREKHGGEQSDGSEFGSIQHLFLFLLWLDQ
jgi:hypothetical protein